MRQYHETVPSSGAVKHARGESLKYSGDCRFLRKLSLFDIPVIIIRVLLCRLPL